MVRAGVSPRKLVLLVAVVLLLVAGKGSEENGSSSSSTGEGSISCIGTAEIEVRDVSCASGGPVDAAAIVPELRRYETAQHRTDVCLLAWIVLLLVTSLKDSCMMY